jgi:hypothetical protein
MKKFLFTLGFLPLFTLTVLAPLDSAYARSNDNSYEEKKTASALCAAILTATTGVAVYTTNALHVNHNMPIFSLRSPLYRNRKELHVFLARGLGKRFADYFDIDLDLGESDVIAFSRPLEISTPLDDIEKKWDDETFRRSVVFSPQSTPETATGYLLLPGLTARFELHVIENKKVEYTIFDITKDDVLQRGTFTSENPFWRPN